MAMCTECWEENGKPVATELDTYRLAFRLKSADAHGPLHIYVDDWNCSDSNLDFCESQEGLSSHDREVIAVSRLIPENQRIAALAMADGFYGVCSI